MAATRAKFVLRKDRKGLFHWQLQVRNKPVAQSVQGYTSERSARQALEALRNNIVNAKAPE